MGIDISQKSNNNNNSPFLQRVQEKLGILGAVSFTVVRVLSFTKVTARNFLPDCWTALVASNLSFGLRKSIQFIMFGCIGFTFLQWYWFSKILNHARKET